MQWLLIFPLLFLLQGCTKPTEVVCKQTGSKWASANSQCIRPSCAKTKTCGIWANPAKWCDRIKIGDNRENVRFWLGEPLTETINLTTWADKLGEYKIKAEFNNDVLTKFECPSK